eukprot:365845-Chlamydomonas_euryale.AAC.10
MALSDVGSTITLPAPGKLRGACQGPRSYLAKAVCHVCALKNEVRQKMIRSVALSEACAHPNGGPANAPGN